MFEHLTTAATVIGYFVMSGWILLLIWFIVITIGEVQFNRRMKRQSEKDWDNARSDWLLEDRQKADDRHDTDQLPHFHFLQDEDITPTVETAAVFDIRERYPHEFA